MWARRRRVDPTRRKILFRWSSRMVRSGNESSSCLSSTTNCEWVCAASIALSVSAVGSNTRLLIFYHLLIKDVKRTWMNRRSFVKLTIDAISNCWGVKKLRTDGESGDSGSFHWISLLLRPETDQTTQLWSQSRVQIVFSTGLVSGWPGRRAFKQVRCMCCWIDPRSNCWRALCKFSWSPLYVWGLHAETSRPAEKGLH